MDINSREVQSRTTESINLNNKDNLLIFPANVYDVVQASSGMKKSEKNGIIVAFYIFANALVLWLLLSFLRGIVPGYYGWITLAVMIVIQLTVGMILLRFVLDEQTIMSEMDNKDNNFSKYFDIYKEMTTHKSKAYPFDVIEFTDGTYGVYIQLRMGYNTRQRSEETYHANKNIIDILNKSGMQYKKVYHNEDFGSSEAAKELRDSVKRVTDPKLFPAYRDMVQKLLTIADEKSNVLSTTYIVYARTKIQKDDLGKVIENIMQVNNIEDTAYRSAEILGYQQIVGFYRNCYKLNVLDMGMLRAHSLKKREVSCNLTVLRIYGKSNKVYNTADNATLRSEIMKEYGLTQVNE